MVGKIGRAMVRQKTGDLRQAERELRYVLAEARARTDNFVEARACHDLAATMFFARRLPEAVSLAFKAHELYEETSQRARALGDMGTFLKELGHYSAAKEAFGWVLDNEAGAEVRVNVILELLELSATTQDRLGFARWRKEAQRSYDAFPPEQKIDFEMKMGIGLVSFGASEDAIVRFSRALSLAQEFNFGQQIFEAEDQIREAREGEHAKALPLPSEPEPTEPELRDAIEGLYALRSGVS
jgi:tetratricopeptide (TPR) repeat protein